ncbi:MAG: adenylosuccinate lyase [Deltaproteobacteria bacterium]|nr:adenylosuccinate lyase [Deltaproteobacteria bacterium]
MISRYQRERMTVLWSDQKKYETWLQVELAICHALVRQKILSPHQFQAIKKKACFKAQDILAEEKKSKHDVAAFVTVVSKKLGEEGRFFHYGVTSSDILDTSFGLLLKEACEILLKDIKELLHVLKSLAFKHKKTLMVGRSHGIHAEPTTFGLKCALWFAEMKRNEVRLLDAKSLISVGKISGAVGTYAHLPSQVEKDVCEELGLEPESIATQVIQRDRHAQVFTTLAILASSIEKVAVEIRHLQRTEVAELSESFSKGQKGSSSMPHKKNPILSENLSGLARLVRSYAQASLENIALWHERDISHSSVERVIAPDATSLVDFMLVRLSDLLKNLYVDPKKMLQNLNLTRGLIYSQKLLLVLIRKGLSREKAYEVVQSLSLQAHQDQQNFQTLISKSSEIRSHLSDKEIKNIFHPQSYVQEVENTFKKVFS